MRITQLELQNIGVFENQIFEFNKPDNGKAEIHILTGINGSGKSTVLYALASLFNFEPVKKRYRFTDEKSSVKVLFEEQTIPFKIGYDGPKKTPERKPKPPMAKSFDIPDGRKGASLTISFYADNPIKVYQTYLSSTYDEIKDKKFQFAIFAYSGSRSLSSSDIRSIEEIQNHPLQDSLNFQKPVDSKILLQWIANTKAKVAFALQEGNTETAERYKLSLSRIENVIKEIVGYDVQFTFHYEPLAVGINVNNENLEFDVLPDGLKSIISWIADLLMRLERMNWEDNTNILDRKFILLLDEIEIHLHPSWQRKILPVVQNLFRNAQIFIATHSPFVVASVSDAWVYKLSVLNGKAEISEIVESKAGSSYPLVLDEIFDVDEYFDVETENIFKQFYQLKQELLAGDEKNTEKLMNLSRQLALKGIEVRDIIGRELRQLQRLTGKDLNI